jgi:hypothetical protein
MSKIVVRCRLFLESILTSDNENLSKIFKKYLFVIHYNHTNMHIYATTAAIMHSYIHTHTYIHKHTHKHTYINANTYTHTYIYTYIHYKHIYTIYLTYIHTYIHTLHTYLHYINYIHYIYTEKQGSDNSSSSSG